MAEQKKVPTSYLDKAHSLASIEHVRQARIYFADVRVARGTADLPGANSLILFSLRDLARAADVRTSKPAAYLSGNGGKRIVLPSYHIANICWVDQDVAHAFLARVEKRIWHVGFDRAAVNRGCSIGICHAIADFEKLPKLDIADALVADSRRLNRE